MHFTEMRLVFVEWIDSRGVSSSWMEFDHLKDHGVCVIRSVGWLLRDEDDLIQLIPHVGEDPDQACGDMVIPRTQVKRVVDLVEKAD